MACKKGQFYVVERMANEQLIDVSINLNAQYLNGMTPIERKSYMNIIVEKFEKQFMI